MRIKNSHLALILLTLIILTGCQPEEESSTLPISRLQGMSEMATVEVVVSKIVKVQSDKTWYTYGDRKILMSVTARIKAGIDMSDISVENMTMTDDYIRLHLPPAEIISLNVDPESIREVFSHRDFFRDDFSNEERYELLKQAEKDIRRNIPDMGVIERAETHAILFFESWLRSMGYKKVIVLIRKPDISTEIPYPFEN